MRPYAGGQRVAMRVKDENSPDPDEEFYLLSDHLGSTSVVVDKDGQVVSELRYQA